MKIEIKEKQEIKEGSVRIVQRFLFFPKILNTSEDQKFYRKFFRWLEIARWKQVYICDRSEDFGNRYNWEDICWIDIGR